MKNVTNLLMWGGAIAGVGAFGYKMVQKARGVEVKPQVDAIMYAGIGATAIGFAITTATGAKAPVKIG